MNKNKNIGFKFSFSWIISLVLAGVLGRFVELFL